MIEQIPIEDHDCVDRYCNDPSPSWIPVKMRVGLEDLRFAVPYESRPYRNNVAQFNHIKSVLGDLHFGYSLHLDRTLVRDRHYYLFSSEADAIFAKMVLDSNDH